MKVNAEITLNSKDSSVFKVSFKENVTKKYSIEMKIQFLIYLTAVVICQTIEFNQT